MFDTNAYYDYIKFLSSIPQHMIKHYFIDDAAFQDPNDIKALLDLGYTHIDNILRYDNYPKNNHHWTTTFVWEQLLPMLNNDLRLGFTSTDFNKIRVFRDGYDLSFHNPVTNPIVTVIDYNGSSTTNRFDKIIRSYDARGNDIEESWSPYHALFRQFHKCCIAVNNDTDTSRVLLLNTDSMSVPVIPLLIPYYKKIYVLDNRTGTSWINNVMKKEITDYVALGLTRQYVVSTTFAYRNTSNNKIFKQNVL